MLNVYVFQNTSVTGVGPIFDATDLGDSRTFQAIVSGTGTYSCTFTIKISNDSENWIDYRTVTLSNTDGSVDISKVNGVWAFYTAEINSISNCSLTLIMAAQNE